MNPIQLQLVILAGAYAVALVFTLIASVSSWLAIRSLRSLEAKRSVFARLTTVENEMRSHADLVDRLSKRWAKRFRDEASSKSTASSPATQDDLDRDALLAEYRAQNGGLH